MSPAIHQVPARGQASRLGEPEETIQCRGRDRSRSEIAAGHGVEPKARPVPAAWDATKRASILILRQSPSLVDSA